MSVASSNTIACPASTVLALMISVPLLLSCHSPTSPLLLMLLSASATEVPVSSIGVFHVPVPEVTCTAPMLPT